MGRFATLRCYLGFALLCAFNCCQSNGQEPAVQQHILLPPTAGATALSTAINAEAAYVAAAGDYLVSAAVARRHNALAAEQEMRNSVLWVNTYFERRELNRSYRAKEEPAYPDVEKKHQEMVRDRISQRYQEATRGDFTGDLNWLLRELPSSVLFYQVVPVGQAAAGQNRGALTEQDIHHVRLTDGKGAFFRADESRPLATRWPRILRGPEYEEERRHFEETRDEILKKRKAEQDLSWQDEQKLTEAVDRICSSFNAAYPPSRRVESSAVFKEYTVGKRFLQSLAAGVYRVIETNDLSIFDGSRCFHGENVAMLVRHLYENGLEFAPPEPGDEGAYRKIFFEMRSLYQSMLNEGSAP
jgi:hypothetical protein